MVQGSCCNIAISLTIAQPYCADNSLQYALIPGLEMGGMVGQRCGESSTVIKSTSLPAALHRVNLHLLLIFAIKGYGLKL